MSFLENARTFRDELSQSFQLKTLVPTVISSTVISLMTMVISVSFVVLIFVDPIQNFTGYGTHIMLLTAVIMALFMALFSSYAGTIAIPQDRVAPIIALMGSQIIVQMRDKADPLMIGYTVLASIATSALLTGVCLYLLGQYRLGNVVRFIPYPVIGGFLAGSGWLLVTGSFRVMSGSSFSLSDAETALASNALGGWLCCVIFGIVAYLAVRLSRHFFVLPLFIFLSIGLFYGWLYFHHYSLENARQFHWILAAPSGSETVEIKTLTALHQANWSVIAQRYDSFGAILLTSVVSILLNTSALELAANEDIDLNQELRVAGMANFFAGTCGGMVGFQSLSLSSLSLSMGMRSRLISLFSALICLAMLWFGAGLLGYVPLFVLGGILFYTGLTFLVEWAFDSYWKLAREDYLLIILILSIVAVGGYLQGVGSGILIATILFVVKYSTINVINRTMSGDSVHSSVDRSPAAERTLAAHGSEIYILRLKGYIFFGSANAILNTIKERLTNPGLSHLRYVILDFYHVSGLDTSAMLSLSKLMRLARKEEFVLLLATSSVDLQNQFLNRDILGGEKDELRFFPDQDHALEWCENEILRRYTPENEQADKSIVATLQEAHLLRTQGEELLRYLEEMDVDKNYYLMHQGDSSDGLFFINSGRVRVLVKLDNGQTMRVRTMGAGTVVGEIGLYLNQSRVASVITEEPCRIYRLAEPSLRKMEQENPKLATAFHEFMVRLLAERVAYQNLTLRALGD